MLGPCTLRLCLTPRRRLLLNTSLTYSRRRLASSILYQNISLTSARPRLASSIPHIDLFMAMASLPSCHETLMHHTGGDSVTQCSANQQEQKRRHPRERFLRSERSVLALPACTQRIASPAPARAAAARSRPQHM
eukprot:scaffold43228_cov264-Isochrysis_galbana.AAC.3